MTTYRGSRDFLARYRTNLEPNIGSRMIPIRYTDSCQCYYDEICTDTIRSMLWGWGEMEMPTAENMEVAPA